MNERIAQANIKGEFDFDKVRLLKEHDNVGPVRALTEMLLVIQPDVLLKYLVVLSKKELNQTLLVDDSYKIKGSYVGDNGKKLEFAIEILKIDEQTCCAQFNKKSGDAVEFYRIVNELYKEPINKLLDKVSTVKKAWLRLWL